MVVSERVGEVVLELEGGEHRLEYTEYGSGDRHVLLMHGQLMVRRMHEPLARALAGQGFHVISLDLLGHGRSDRPADPCLYSMSDFATQVVGVLDHLGIDRAVVGGTSLGANVSLEVAVLAPERLQGLLLEMPVLDNAVEAGIIAFAPLMWAGRFAPLTVDVVRWATKPWPRALLPFWPGVVLDMLDQQPDSMAAVVHGIFFGRIAPPPNRRRQIDVPALVVGHPADPIHPAADAAKVAKELPRARFVKARSFLEWRIAPDRLDAEAVAFVRECWGEAQRDIGTAS